MQRVFRTCALWVVCAALPACGPPDTSLRELDAEISRTAGTSSLSGRFDGPPIRIVGSSTVAPFSETVAEQFGAASAYRTPIVETTGTGGGFKSFCAGKGAAHPSIINASRPILPSERALCAANGIRSIVEIPIGYDGIAIVNARSGPAMSLTKTQLFLALADELPVAGGGWASNPNMSWRDISPELPDMPIRVSGPPPTSGTRDAFLQLAMEPGALGLPELAALQEDDPRSFLRRVQALRNDGAWIDSGENDAAIIQTLLKNDRTLGVLGFSFLDQNADRVRAVPVSGVVPTVETIASGEYGVSRSLFFYIREEDVRMVPGLADYVLAFTHEDALGPDGYLTERGLIPLPATVRADVRARAEAMVERADLSDR